MVAAPLAAVLLAAGPSLLLAPASARPGDAVLVRVQGSTDAPQGALGGRALEFWRAGDEWRALASLPIETPAGAVAASATAGGASVDAAVEIVEPGFPSRTLHVAPRFVEPPARVKHRIEADRHAFLEAYARPFGPPLFTGDFAWPYRAPLTGRFGDQRVFNGKKESVHYGLDIDGPRGGVVRAANDGVVVLARNAYLSGNSVVVAHGAGVFTIYFHMDRIRVRPGERVAKGAPLGIIGSTGRSTGPHLHWSARVAGLFVDPESLLGIDFASGTAPARLPGAAPAAPPPVAATPPAAPLPASARSGEAPAPVSPATAPAPTR